MALAVEADRMRNAFINESDRQTEMTVVRNEFERGENDPHEALDKAVWATAYQVFYFFVEIFTKRLIHITTQPLAGNLTSRTFLLVVQISSINLIFRKAKRILQHFLSPK